MALSWLVQASLTMGLGALGALLGAILLWKYYALPKISRWIIEQGSGRLKAWMASVTEDPQGPEAQQIGKLTGVAFSYALQGLAELTETKEGRERLAPLLGVVQEHIQQSIFATWGHILSKLKESGGSFGAGEGMGIPPELLGLGEKLIPKQMREAGIGLPSILKLAQMLSAFKGSTGGAVSSGGNGDIYTIR